MTRTRQSLVGLLLVATVLSRYMFAQTPLSATVSPDAIVMDGPIDPAQEAAAELVPTVSEAVTALDATGDRNLEAIVNSTVTLTLAPLQDSSRLRVLCLNAGAPLQAFMQSLAENLQLQGQVLHPACAGAGSDTDPFTLQFHLHFEGGHAGLFQQTPLLLPTAIYSPAYFESEALDRAGDEDQPIDKRLQTESEAKPILLKSPRTLTSHSVMALPEGWSASKLPDPIHADSAFVAYDRTMAFTDGNLVADTRLTIKKDKVEVMDRPAFEKWLESAQILYFGGSVPLASTMYYPESAFTGTTEDEKKAAQLINNAYNDIQSKNLVKAQADLAQAEALDPGHEILHENKGELAAARGDYTGALREYEQELHAFPNALVEMESIAKTQRRLGRTDDAIATLQRWAAGDPKSIFPVVQLMELYHGMGRDDLAVGVGDQAMLSLNKDGKRSVKFLMRYGQEQLLVGQAQAAKATFEALLEETTDIEFVNDAAYLLSERGLALDRGEETIRASLVQFDADHMYDMGHIYNLDDKQRTDLLFATWDTLGWILYKEGKTTEAEAYIRAAWLSHPDPAIGLHLGQILNDHKESVAALNQYKLALATVPAKDEQAASKTPDVIALHAEITRLEGEGHVSTIADPAGALAKLRVLDAGPAGKLRGETRYRLTITPAGISSFPLDPRAATDFTQVIQAIKLPQDFFPPDSHAVITREATIKCAEVCSVTLQP